VAFLTLGLAQILHLGNARSHGPVLALARIFANRHALGAVALAIGLQWLVTAWTPLATVLGVRAVSPGDWGVIALLALTPAVLGQAIKSVRDAWNRTRRRAVG